MLEKYKTLCNIGEIELVEKKSKFLAIASSVENEEVAQNIINKICKKYYNATHHVFAYVIGEKNEIQKFSDDGEPSGTAGIPILNLLKNENIKNVLIIVTRYFGGTLLGTGGLVRAYTKSAKEAILAAGIVEKILYQVFNIYVDYNLSGKIQYEMSKQNYILKNIVYEEKVKFTILVLPKDIINFEKYILDLTNANVDITKLEQTYYF